MKKFSFFASLLIIGTFILSCTKNEIYYSCDPKLDAWVKDNIEEIRVMPMEEWFEMDYKYARPAYNALESNTKFKIWETKLKDVLRYEWNNKEKAHISTLLQYATTNKRIFEDSFNKDYQLVLKTQSFLNSWYNYAVNNLGWNKELIYAISSDPHFIADTKGGIIVKENGIEMLLNLSRGRGDLLDCNCNLGSIWYLDCSSVLCNESSTGCGGFCLFACNGRHNLGEPDIPIELQ